ncbi:MAG: peptidase M15 [Candidatus Paceibacterota bacterium]
MATARRSAEKIKFRADNYGTKHNTRLSGGNVKYYEPKYFRVEEYVPPEIYAEKGDESILLMDDRILKTDDAIREFFGVAVIINNWHNGGDRRYSGYRPPNCTVGAYYSQHRFGRASDKIMLFISTNTIRDEIIKNRKAFPYITVMEKNVSWLHTDCRCVADTNSIQLISP